MSIQHPFQSFGWQSCCRLIHPQLLQACKELAGQVRRSNFRLWISTSALLLPGMSASFATDCVSLLMQRVSLHWAMLLSPSWMSHLFLLKLQMLPYTRQRICITRCGPSLSARRFVPTYKKGIITSVMAPNLWLGLQLPSLRSANISTRRPCLQHLC